MPREAPVTSATLPSSRPMILLSRASEATNRTLAGCESPCAPLAPLYEIGLRLSSSTRAAPHCAARPGDYGDCDVDWLRLGRRSYLGRSAGGLEQKLPPLTDQLLALGDRLLGQPGGIIDVAVDLRDPAALYFGEL